MRSVSVSERASAVAHAQCFCKNGGQTPLEISDSCCCLQPSACPISSCHQGTGIWRYWSINGFVLCGYLDGLRWKIELISTVNRPVWVVSRHCPTASNKHSSSLHTPALIQLFCYQILATTSSLFPHYRVVSEFLLTYNPVYRCHPI